jgi:hypothetical protein
MSYAWYDLLGNVGVALIIGAYGLMQLRRLEATGLTYSALNAAGALLIIVSLIFDFNASAMIVEVFWFAISALGIGRCLMARRSTSS